MHGSLNRGDHYREDGWNAQWSRHHYLSHRRKPNLQFSSVALRAFCSINYFNHLLAGRNCGRTGDNVYSCGRALLAFHLCTSPLNIYLCTSPPTPALCRNTEKPQQDPLPAWIRMNRHPDPSSINRHCSSQSFQFSHFTITAADKNEIGSHFGKEHNKPKAQHESCWCYAPLCWICFHPFYFHIITLLKPLKKIINWFLWSLESGRL